MERHYYTINLYDRFNPSEGYSVCVWTYGEESDEYLLKASINFDLIDESDLKDMNVEVADITNDEHEMKFWENEAIGLANC